MSHYAAAVHEQERLLYFGSAEGRDDLYQYNQREGVSVGGWVAFVVGCYVGVGMVLGVVGLGMLVWLGLHTTCINAYTHTDTITHTKTYNI